jgi:hypothetical protein
MQSLRHLSLRVVRPALRRTATSQLRAFSVEPNESHLRAMAGVQQGAKPVQMDDARNRPARQRPDEDTSLGAVLDRASHTFFMTEIARAFWLCPR